MDVIVIDSEAYQKLLGQLQKTVKTAIRDVVQPPPEWLKPRQAMELLGVQSKTTLQNLRDKNEIIYTQYERSIRYSRQGILDFLERYSNRNM